MKKVIFALVALTISITTLSAYAGTWEVGQEFFKLNSKGQCYKITLINADQFSASSTTAGGRDINALSDRGTYTQSKEMIDLKYGGPWQSASGSQKKNSFKESSSKACGF